MGLLSSSKKIANQMFNFRIHDWFGAKNHQSNLQYLNTSIKNLFASKTAENTETFEQAMSRLQITEEDLKLRKQEFFQLFIIFLIISCALFIYTMLITIKYKNFYGFILGVSVTLLSLAQAFKYHFWLTQVVKRKLGLTLKDWLSL